jgi:hypothetical protein
VQGSDLAQHTVDILNQLRGDVFGLGENSLGTRDNFADHIFLLLEKGEDIKSFGRLIPLTVSFREKDYDILGNSSLISTEPGYGRKLFSLAKKHFYDPRSIVGFCKDHTVNFHRRVSMGVLEGAADRFIYEKDGVVIPNQGGDNVIYTQNKGNLIKDFIDNPNDYVHLPRPHW